VDIEVQTRALEPFFPHLKGQATYHPSIFLKTNNALYASSDFNHHHCGWKIKTIVWLPKKLIS
jgi:hypothetical protein